MVSTLDFQAGYHRCESRSGRDNFQTIGTPCSYSKCPGLSIKWTGQRLVTDSGSMKARLYKYMYITIATASMCLGCLVALKIPTTTTHYHTCPNMWTSPFYFLFMNLKTAG